VLDACLHVTGVLAICHFVVASGAFHFACIVVDA